MRTMNKNYFNDNVKDANLADFSKVEDNKEKLFQNAGSGALAKFFDDIKILYYMATDYISGKYCEIPFTSIAAIIGTLVYVISPVDLIPDYIPVLGLVDDAFCVKLCLSALGTDLEKYKKWKKKNN